MRIGSLEEERNDSVPINFMQEPQFLAKVLYKSCVDEESLQALGHDPLREALDRLGGWPVLSNTSSSSDQYWAAVAGRLMRGKSNFDPNRFLEDR